MRKVTCYVIILVLSFMMACQKEVALNPEGPEIYEWEAPARLTHDIEQNIHTIEKLSGQTIEIEKEIGTAKNGKMIVLPENSADELQDAINTVGEKGLVVLMPGDHHESGTVTVSHRVTILGLPGAKILSGVQNTSVVSYVQPAIHILDASHTVVAGIQFIPTAGAEDGGTVLLIENADYVLTTLNKSIGFQFGIVLEQADFNRIIGNEIITTAQWPTLIEAHGVMVINGKNANLSYNHISNSFFGVWACDEGGLFKDNYMDNSYLGLILCNVPAASFTLPSGQAVGSQTPGTNWTVLKNQSDNHVFAGYLVIDGANNNVLTNNKASGNGAYDIELVGDSFRFGFLTPSSHDNVVNDAGQNLTIKDCGNNNTVNGGIAVDITVDPCF